MTGLTAMPLEAGHVFYDVLFRESPQLRPLFGDDLDAQAEKLVDMMLLVVHFLDEVDALSPEIEELGTRHVGYGVAPMHLEVAKNALLEAFATTLPDWDAEDHAAWNALLCHLMHVMQKGMTDAVRSDALRGSA